jgi:hypothetical protein
VLFPVPAFLPFLPPFPLCLFVFSLLDCRFRVIFVFCVKVLLHVWVLYPSSSFVCNHVHGRSIMLRVECGQSPPLPLLSHLWLSLSFHLDELLFNLLWVLVPSFLFFLNHILRILTQCNISAICLPHHIGNVSY